MVRVRGFEAPASAFQVRSSGLCELHPVQLAFPTGIEPACLPVRSRALVQLSYGKSWCDEWDSNPRCCAENADAWPLAERRLIGSGRRIRTCRILINSQAHPPRTVDNWWTDWESNPARVACKASLRPGGRPNESAFTRVLMSNTSAYTRVFRKWCSDVVSSHALLLFRQALSPD
jgi:hypothetical protein